MVATGDLGVLHTLMAHVGQGEEHTLEQDHLIKDFFKVVFHLIYLLLLMELMQLLIRLHKPLQRVEAVVGGKLSSVLAAVRRVT